MAKAKELIFCAKVLSGREALEIGLAEYSVEQNEDGNAAYLKALELAKEIASKVCAMTSCTILTNENELCGVAKETRSFPVLSKVCRAYKSYRCFTLKREWLLLTLFLVS